MKSLSGQLTLRLVISCVLLFGAAGGALYWHVTRDLGAEFDGSLRATGSSLLALIEQDDNRVRLTPSPGSMPQFEQKQGPEVFELLGEDGREIARSRSLGTATLPVAAGLYNVTLPDGRIVRCANLPYTVTDEDEEAHTAGAQPNPKVVLIVGRDRLPLDATFASIRSSMMVVGAGALAMLVLLIPLGVRAGLEPVKQFGVQVSMVNAGSLATRFPVVTLPAELHPIVAGLNALLARLEAAFERQRRFTATAAHEFRTPLAELKTVAEVSLAVPASEAERTQAWRDILSVTTRMQSLATCLLQLTRTENGAASLKIETIPLLQMLREAWGPFEKGAAERGIELVAEVPPGVAFQTDAALLRVILGNLCGNAASHAATGSPFTVAACENGSAVEVRFRNKAADIAEGDVEHLFERFWRKDAARHDNRHHGLGLSISAEIAKVLGGSLLARMTAEREIEFLLTLPTRPD